MRDRAKKWTHRKAIRFTTSVSRLPFHGFVSRKKRSNREDDVRLVPILPRVEAAARAGQSCRERPRVAPRDAICSDAEDPPAYMSTKSYQVFPPRCSTAYSLSSSSLPCSIARGLFSTGTVPVRVSRLRPCVFLPRVLYRFAPQLQTREKHKATQGEAAGVYTGVPGERRLPLLA